MLSTYPTPPTQLPSTLPHRTASLSNVPKQNSPVNPLVQSREDANYARVVLTTFATNDEDKAALQLDVEERARRYETRAGELTEMLDRMTYWAEELATLLQQAYKNQTELETALTLARSNLQLALANNEMLEEALKRGGGGGHDVGWRRWSEREGVRRSGSVKDYVQHDRPNSIQDLPSSSSLPAPPQPQQQNQPPSAPSRFFSFKSSLQRISNPSTSPTATSPSPPFASASASASASTSSLLPPITIPSSSRGQSRVPSPAPAPQVTAIITSDPSSSRASSPSPTHSIPATSLTNSHSHTVSHSTQQTTREKELASLLDKERAAVKALSDSKTQLEDELESLSQALFEEANKMVSIANRKLAETEEELRIVTEQKEALWGALRIVEGENGTLRGISDTSRDADRREEQHIAGEGDEQQLTGIDAQQAQTHRKGTSALQSDDAQNASLSLNPLQSSLSDTAHPLSPSQPHVNTRPTIPIVTMTVQNPTITDDKVSWSLNDTSEGECRDTPRLSSLSLVSPSYMSMDPAETSSPNAPALASELAQGDPLTAPIHRLSMLPANPSSRNVARSEFENAMKRMRDLIGEGEEVEEEKGGMVSDGAGEDQEHTHMCVPDGQFLVEGDQSDVHVETVRTNGGSNPRRT